MGYVYKKTNFIRKLSKKIGGSFDKSGIFVI